MIKRGCFIVLSMALIAALAGCSGMSVPMIPEEDVPAKSREMSAQEWVWGRWMFHVNESHDSIEAVPVRGGEWHLNVTKFLETQPCQNCLNIGVVTPQGDGSVKVKVSLTHPFPGVPRYTGFDVCGLVIFPATKYWETGHVPALNNNYVLIYDQGCFPFYFSWKGDGGAQLLNADGYSYYFWPGLDLGTGYEAPIFNYQQGKHASPDTPDSTINPYLSFNDGSARRMFKTSDLISRDYHIHLPEGEFSFGYIVAASWVQPDTFPVTNPELDFPVEANSESTVNIQFEQYLPLDPDDPYQKNGGTWAKITFNKSPHITTANTWIIAPDVLYWANPPYGDVRIAYFAIDDPEEISPGIFEYNYICGISSSGFQHPPYVNGTYPALVRIYNLWSDPNPEPGATPATLIRNSSFQLVEVELAASGN